MNQDNQLLVVLLFFIIKQIVKKEKRLKEYHHYSRTINVIKFKFWAQYLLHSNLFFSVLTTFTITQVTQGMHNVARSLRTVTRIPSTVRIRPVLFRPFSSSNKTVGDAYSLYGFSKPQAVSAKTLNDIKKILLKLYHPDLNKKYTKQAHEKFIEINQAFKVIQADQKSPQNYNFQLLSLSLLEKELRESYTQWQEEIEYQALKKKKQEEEENLNKARQKRIYRFLGIVTTSCFATYFSYIFYTEFIRAELIRGILNNDIDRVRKALSNNISSIREKNEEGDTALHMAIKWNRPEIAQQLIDSGADINETDSNQDTALLIAVKNGYEEIVKILIAAQSKFIKDKRGKSPLICAAEQNNQTLVSLLLPHSGVDDLSDLENISLSNFVYKLWGESYSRCNSNVAARTFSTYVNNTDSRLIEEMQELQREGYDINLQVLLERNGILHWAVAGNKQELLNFLLQNNADVHVVNELGRTALFYANNWEVAQQLLKQGASIAVTDKLGNAVYHAAMHSPHCGHGLITQYGKLGTQRISNSDGNTPWHMLAYACELHTEEQLLDKAIAYYPIGQKFLEQKNNNNISAAQIAEKRVNTKCKVFAHVLNELSKKQKQKK